MKRKRAAISQDVSEAKVGKKFWTDFITAPVEALPLRIFEIAFAISYLLRMTRNFPVAEWLTEEGFHLTNAEWQALGYPASFPLLPLWGAYVYLALTVGAVVCLAFSLRWRRAAVALLFFSALYAQGVDYLSATSANKQYIAVFAMLMTGPGIWLNAATGRWMVSAAMVRVLQATLLTIYFAAGWAKCFAGDWLTHTDVLFTQLQGIHRNELAAWALRTLPMWAWTAQQYVALGFELAAPVLIGWRRLRPVGFVLGIGMHLMIALLMENLIYFSLTMWTYYVLFVPAGQWRRLWSVKV
ncbi:MAG: hypothetical protein ABL974_02760 [Prosthecobacter sp.]